MQYIAREVYLCSSINLINKFVALSGYSLGTFRRRETQISLSPIFNQLQNISGENHDQRFCVITQHYRQ
jgi:hypothetical protein